MTEGGKKTLKKKTSKKKPSWKDVFLYFEMNLVFIGMFFYFPKLTVFFGNRQQSNASAEKKTFFLLMRSLNLMRALI